MLYFSGRSGERGRARHGRGGLPLHAELEPGEDHARVSGADDRLPAPPLERQPQGHEGAAMLKTRGKCRVTYQVGLT